ncbi:MAG: hydantoinase B/oxoprolinase family protein, partial [Candidatus Rokuibacteriota bacterium]
FRGGCGVRRDLRLLGDEGKLTNLAERQKFAPYGLGGGRPGRLGRTVLNPGPGEQVVHGKQSREFAYGDVVSFQQPGAGGYGDPFEREPRRVLEDVLDDYVSIEAARREYGVVIMGAAADLSVDEAATRHLRAEMAADRNRRDADGNREDADRPSGPADRNGEDAAARSTAVRSRRAPVSGHPRSEPTSRPPLQ